MPSGFHFQIHQGVLPARLGGHLLQGDGVAGDLLEMLADPFMHVFRTVPLEGQAVTVYDFTCVFLGEDGQPVGAGLVDRVCR